jgi:hypothetical protein
MSNESCRVNLSRESVTKNITRSRSIFVYGLTLKRTVQSTGGPGTVTNMGGPATRVSASLIAKREYRYAIVVTNSYKQ